MKAALVELLLSRIEYFHSYTKKEKEVEACAEALGHIEGADVTGRRLGQLRAVSEGRAGSVSQWPCSH